MSIVKRMGACALACLLALALSLSSAAWDASSAWAAEGDAGKKQTENLVNPHQLPDSSFIYDTSIFELNTSDTYYANQTVQITGEVVGDLVRSETDGSKCWITVSALPDDQPATIQAYVSRSDAKNIDTFGRYGSVGSTVVIKGTYYLVCAEHDGLSDIHADSFAVVEPGSVNKEHFRLSDFFRGFALVALGLALVAYYRWNRERMR